MKKKKPNRALKIWKALNKRLSKQKKLTGQLQEAQMTVSSKVNPLNRTKFALFKKFPILKELDKTLKRLKNPKGFATRTLFNAPTLIKKALKKRQVRLQKEATANKKNLRLRDKINRELKRLQKLDYKQMVSDLKGMAKETQTIFKKETRQLMKLRDEAIAEVRSRKYPKRMTKSSLITDITDAYKLRDRKRLEHLKKFAKTEAIDESIIIDGVSPKPKNIEDAFIVAMQQEIDSYPSEGIRNVLNWAFDKWRMNNQGLEWSEYLKRNVDWETTNLKSVNGEAITQNFHILEKSFLDSGLDINKIAPDDEAIAEAVALAELL